MLVNCSLMNAKYLDPFLPQIHGLCVEFGVLSLAAFGSVLRPDFGDSSDIDFLVEFERDGYQGAFQQLMGFKEALEGLLGRPVDLIVRRDFRNVHFRAELERTSHLLYAA